MAEYWKSQARKYCDFCKCWIADNKPSIEYHEGGKKHKENVAKRLKEIYKKSAKQAKQQIKYENDIDKMEKAAMAAYLKDVESNTRDMTADNIAYKKQNKIEGSKKQEQESYNLNDLQYDTSNAQSEFKKSNYHVKYSAADIDPLDPYAKQKLARLAARKTKVNKEVKKNDSKSHGCNTPEKEKSKNKMLNNSFCKSKLPISKIWYEAQVQGHSYYWNIKTNESVWEPPAEGFISLTEQAEELKEQAVQEKFLKEIEKEQKKERAEILEEQRANIEREKFKEIRTQFLKNENEKHDNMEFQDVPYRRFYDIPDKPQPYGSWKVVKTIETPKIDLQLPQTETPIPIISFQEDPTPKVFKEKTITHLFIDKSDDEGSVESFKKRKFGNKNVRKRMMDD